MHSCTGRHAHILAGQLLQLHRILSHCWVWLNLQRYEVFISAEVVLRKLRARIYRVHWRWATIGIGFASFQVKFFSSLPFFLVEPRHKLIDYILHSSIWTEVEQRLSFVNNGRADRTAVASLEVLYDARLTERVQTLGDGGGVNQVAGT